jgi:hypothetical protein
LDPQNKQQQPTKKCKRIKKDNKSLQAWSTHKVIVENLVLFIIAMRGAITVFALLGFVTPVARVVGALAHPTVAICVEPFAVRKEVVKGWIAKSLIAAIYLKQNITFISSLFY